MELAKFDQLGQRIEALLARLDEMARAKEDLGHRLEEKDREISALNEKVTAYEQERIQVRTRVDELLGRIDQYEAGQA
ncbi:MAG: cell division protein ZapB [Deltaproteobacteria bacterium]|nr:cell division protein ZapB [Deltaproteobacteria bacterium]